MSKSTNHPRADATRSARSDGRDRAVRAEEYPTTNGELFTVAPVVHLGEIGMPQWQLRSQRRLLRTRHRRRADRGDETDLAQVREHGISGTFRGHSIAALSECLLHQ